MTFQYTFSDDQLTKAVETSHAWTDVCRKLGLKPYSRTGPQKRAQELNLNTSHFHTITQIKYNTAKNEERVQKAVQSSISYAEALRKLNLAPIGGNYQTLKRYIKAWNIDTSHFKGQGWNNGKKLKQEHQSKGFRRKWLFKERGKQCEKCRHKTWNKQPISLEIHHIDGNRQNNDPDNLKILCPNCHAQTHNYRSKNHGKAKDTNGIIGY